MPDLRRYQKLVRRVKRVYPVSKIARRKLAEMEERLGQLPNRKEQKAYIRQVYHEIKEEYTPILKRMTRTEGRVLLKLIDRETEYTAYEVLREFRGGFVAGFWQSVSRIFGQNLKSEYDAEGEDRMIEQIIIYYEPGCSETGRMRCGRGKPGRRPLPRPGRHQKLNDRPQPSDMNDRDGAWGPARKLSVR